MAQKWIQGVEEKSLLPVIARYLIFSALVENRAAFVNDNQSQPGWVPLRQHLKPGESCCLMHFKLGALARFEQL